MASVSVLPLTVPDISIPAPEGADVIEVWDQYGVLRSLLGYEQADDLNLPKLMIVMVGLPASGKTVYCRQFLPDIPRVSVLDIARMMAPPEDSMRIFSSAPMAELMLNYLLGRGESVVVDDRNLTGIERHRWIRLAKRYNTLPIAVFMDVSVARCIEGDMERPPGIIVGPEIMSECRSRLQIPTEAEGFERVNVVGLWESEEDE